MNSLQMKVNRIVVFQKLSEKFAADGNHHFGYNAVLLPGEDNHNCHSELKGDVLRYGFCPQNLLSRIRVRCILAFLK